MVRVATRIGSTSVRSPLTRSTARTILLTSTGSVSPFLLRTCIEVLPGAAVTVTSLSSRDRSRRSGVARADGAGQAPVAAHAVRAVGRPTGPRTTPPDGRGALAGLRTRGHAL